MDLLAKHFFIRCKSQKMAMETARFDSLVKNVGSELTPKVYELITYVNEVLLFDSMEYTRVIKIGV